MRIVLTGATGFLGSHLLKALLKEKHEIIILKRSFSKLTRIEKEINQVKAYDIDQHGLEKAFQENTKIDAIIHTATCYGRNQEDIVKIQQTNTQFPLQLLQLAVKHKIKCFYNTDTVLEKETNTYALSKKQFVEWGTALAKQNKLQFINIKLEHIYGPDDDETKFVTYIIKQCLKNIPELKLTKGEQKRDFVYIDDVIAAYLLLLKHQKQQSENYIEYEVATEKPIEIKELVKTIKQKTNSTTELNFGAIPYRDTEIMESHSNANRLKELGWHNEYSIEDGFSACIKGVHIE